MIALSFHDSTRQIADVDFWFTMFLAVMVSISSLVHGGKR
jgi:hypothetical protein